MDLVRCSFLATPAAALLLLAASLSACASEPSESVASADLVAVHPAPIGGTCGDDVSIHTPCTAGLTCVFPTTGPISEHTPGVCRRISKKYEDCGEDVAIQAQCA